MRRSVLLDALRFLAASLIVLYHYGSEGPTPLEQAHPIFLRGYLATDFFLILSGYVLARGYGRLIEQGTISDGDFLLKRVMRVWPAHLMVLAIFVVILGAAALAGVPPHHASHFKWPDLFSQALLIHAWGPFGGQGWNMPSWSLSALLVCYAIFPSLWRRLGAAGGGAVVFALWLGVVLICDLLCRAVLGRGLYDLPFEIGVVRALPLFTLGLCAARAWEGGWTAKASPGWVAAAAGVSAVALQFVGRFDFVSIALLAVMIAAAGQVRSKASRLVTGAAQLSFALYITHILTSMVWFTAERALEARMTLGLAARWALWAASFPIALLAAFLFDRLLDQPVQRGVGVLLLARKPRDAKPAPPAAEPAAADRKPG